MQEDLDIIYQSQPGSAATMGIKWKSIDQLFTVHACAKDFRDTLTMDAAKRVIDAHLHKRMPDRSDVEIVAAYFGT